MSESYVPPTSALFGGTVSPNNVVFCETVPSKCTQRKYAWAIQSETKWAIKYECSNFAKQNTFTVFKGKLNEQYSII